MVYYPPLARYAFHPYLPERWGYRSLLRLLNPELARLLRATDDYTLVNGRNRTTLYREGQAVIRRSVPGEFLEIGVHRGGSAAVLAHILKADPSRGLHLFDRWGDLPEPTVQDGHRQEQYRKDKIQDKLEKLRREQPLLAARQVIEEVEHFPGHRAHYYQGWYEETFAQYKGGPIAFANIDCDYYESVKLSLRFVEGHVSPGALIMIDDYGSWPGAKQATDEWLQSTSLKVSAQPLNIGPAILRVAV